MSDHRLVAVYERNPATPLHPVLRVERVASLEAWQKSTWGDDEKAIDITDHPECQAIDSSWCWHDEKRDFVKVA